LRALAEAKAARIKAAVAEADGQKWAEVVQGDGGQKLAVADGQK